MKKLMVAFAAVAMAICAQAANVAWTCTNVYKGNDTDLNSGIAYLMLASDVADFSALAGKGAAEINKALAKAKYSYTPESAGAYGLTKSNTDLGLKDSTDYGNAYMVIFDTATVSDSSKFYITKNAALVTVEGAFDASLKFGSQATKSKVASNWNAVAAPEPTSGLLLLLGMAGLALRRRRA